MAVSQSKSAGVSTIMNIRVSEQIDLHVKNPYRADALGNLFPYARRAVKMAVTLDQAGIILKVESLAIALDLASIVRATVSGQH